MKIQWIGHSCFLLEDSLGRRVLTDPFHQDLGLNLYSDSLSVVTVSHTHFDHNNTASYREACTIIDSCGYHDLDFVKIHGFESYHDNAQGIKRGNNIIFLFEMDSLRICHLGDLGHILDQITIEKLGKIDVLLVPVGGNFTLNGSEAAKLCSLIRPSLVIPMHYKTPRISMPIEGPEDFILAMKNVEKIKEDFLMIKQVPKEVNKVILLSLNFSE